MRIGILTFHRSINYGAYMQCVALSHEIQKRFPEDSVEVVDYSSAKMEKNYRVKFNKSMVKRPMEFSRRIKRKRIFRDSLKYLPLSDKQIIEDTCENAFDYIKSKYDVIVVGSDAVWNWIKRGFPNPYLLDMGKTDVMKFSYAASAFGMGMEHVTEERRKKFGRSLEDFKFIGVRDEYTEELVRYCAPETKVDFTCDPTAFLDLDYVLELLGTTKEEYKEKIYKKYRIPKNKRLICTMGTTTALVKRLKAEFGNTHTVISVFSNTGAEDVYMYDLDPLEWSLLFGICDITLTNFFHGTLLSLRNSTPVIGLDFTKFGADHKGKIEDVLCRMDMRDCFFRLSEGLADNWDSVIKKTRELLDCEGIRGIIDNNRRCLVYSNESFFDALADALGRKNKKTEAPEIIKRKKDGGFDYSAIKCMGCMLCAEKCPKDAISIEKKKGYYIPAVDNEKCVRCGLCNKICPVNAPQKSDEPKQIYALRDKNETDLMNSSSGGAVGLMAKAFFEAGGSVSGVAYNERMRPVHKVVRSIEEFADLRGSKYVQSSMGDIYTELEAELEKAVPVLATGTPCQIAAIKAYFGDKYDNLYTLDLICHGVQSPVVFEEYIKQLEEEKGKKIVDFKFRDKTKGWKKNNVKVIFDDKSELVMTRAECEYFRYFDYLRQSCYNCHFRGFNNYADVTVGDYWGIETLTDRFNDDKGVSILLCHSEKGRELVDKIKENAKICESNLEHAIKTHRKLKKSVVMPKYRNEFFSILETKGYKAARKYQNKKTRLYNIKKNIKKMIGGK
ncbi:MAG: 4Fe-4S dicluster domain-containing protein [Ruminococcaceae bacterium]|nr:4Fe-4S dicluster domain-containing protein [Oscillospiraceae bacterium]